MDSTPRLRWVVLAACPLLLSIGILALSSAPADAAPVSDCTAHHGTIVAVDFAHWGGPIVRGCGVDAPTGYALLHAAGFTSAGDAHDGAGFVCRIGNSTFRHGTQYPTPSQDPCINTPSTSAYWSYWTAPASQNKWSYNELGAMGDVPHPGEVELWIFGATNSADTSGSGVPTFSPSTLRAASTTTTATGTTTTTSRATTAKSRSTTSTTTTSTHTTSQPATHQRKSSARRRVRTTKRSTRTTSSTTTTPAVVTAKPTSDHTSSGSVAPLVIGISLALVLGAAGAWIAWRRRTDN